jgi:hypothetical protein
MGHVAVAYRDHGPRGDRQKTRLIWLIEELGFEGFANLVAEVRLMLCLTLCIIRLNTGARDAAGSLEAVMLFGAGCDAQQSLSVLLGRGCSGWAVHGMWQRHLVLQRRRHLTSDTPHHCPSPTPPPPPADHGPRHQAWPSCACGP